MNMQTQFSKMFSCEKTCVHVAVDYAKIMSYHGRWLRRQLGSVVVDYVDNVTA